MSARRVPGWILLGAATGSVLGGLAQANTQIVWAILYLPGLLIIGLVVALPTLAAFAVGARLSARYVDLLSAILAIVVGTGLYFLGALVPDLTVLLWPLAYFGGLALATAGGIYAKHRRPREPRRPSGFEEPTEP